MKAKTTNWVTDLEVTETWKNDKKTNKMKLVKKEIKTLNEKCKSFANPTLLQDTFRLKYLIDKLNKGGK